VQLALAAHSIEAAAGDAESSNETARSETVTSETAVTAETATAAAAVTARLWVLEQANELAVTHAAGALIFLLLLCACDMSILSMRF
jgi:hypothetical protein